MSQLVLIKIIENILLSLPYALTYILFGLTLCGFKDKIKKKPIIMAVLILTFFDILTTMMLKQPYGIDTTLVYLIFASITMLILFKLSLLSSFICNIITIILSVITQMFFCTILGKIIGKNTSQIIVLTSNSPIANILIGYTYYLFYILLFMIIYKKNFKVLDLNKLKIFDKLHKSQKIIDNIKLILVILTPLLLLLSVNLAVFYYYSFNQISVSSFTYYSINSIAVLTSGIIMFFLVNRIIKFRHYKADFESQQRYLHDIDELLKNLRIQKHGFMNHMDVVCGLLTHEDYDVAREYLLNIKNTISDQSPNISVGDPVLNALFNVKAKVAQNENIKFNVKVDKELIDFKINVFKLSEALGNIIDNAFEATKLSEQKEQEINITISSDDKYLIFDIQNTGKTIPENVIKKMFEEGFTTKENQNHEHGLGLYIAKQIIDYNKGKIFVESRDNKILFRICLPKGDKNVHKVS